MTDSTLETCVASLPLRQGDVLLKLFTPSPLVQAGRSLDTFTDLRADFDEAAGIYRSGHRQEALEKFLAVRQAADSRHWGAGRTSTLNAAACAVAIGKDQMVTELLAPLHQGRGLFGLPLWNYAIALYRLGRTSEALGALETWLVKAPDGLFRRRGLLVAAALALRAGQDGCSRRHLSAALVADESLALRELGIVPTLPTRETLAPATDAAGAQSLRERLARLVRPRKPERSPALSSFLTQEEMNRFDTALESLADGDLDRAQAELELLSRAHTDVPPLETALAGSRLFAGRNQDALTLLRRSVGANARPSGTTLWNLACAELKAGNLKEAREALLACAETEYRTSSALWAALEILGGRSTTPSKPPPAPERQAFQTRVSGLVADLPSSAQQCRRELLARLLRPQRLPRNYGPDLARLQQRERRAIERVLEAARSAPPSQAVQMLDPVIREHPNSYTLRVHAAAYWLLQESDASLAEGQRLLREAEALRALDATSRMNQAFVCMRREDATGLVRTLEGGSESTLTAKYNFWLALALARTWQGAPRAGEAAARAVAAAGPAVAPIVKQALSAADIKPSKLSEAVDPVIAAANLALDCIQRGDIPQAARAIEELWGFAPQRIPEIGQTILEPKFLRRPKASWDADAIRQFNQAVSGYHNGLYGEAADSFVRLFKSLRSIGLAINGVAACIRAGEPKRALTLVTGAQKQEFIHSSSIGWQLAYNLALAHRLLKKPKEAVAVVRSYLRGHGGQPGATMTRMLVAVCAAAPDIPELRTAMAQGLEDLRAAANPASEELMLALAWAKLTQPIPDAEAAHQALHSIGSGSAPRALPPAAEVVSAKQVRDGYQYLREQGGLSDATTWLQAVVSTKNSEREGAVATSSNEEVVRGIGVELAARRCLVEAQQAQGAVDEALQTFHETEEFLREQKNVIPRGYLANDWLDLARLAERLGLQWAALRFTSEGLRADPDREELKLLEESLTKKLDEGVAKRQAEAALGLKNLVRNVSAKEGAGRVLACVQAPEPLLRDHADLAKLVEPLFDALAGADPGSIDIDDTVERTIARASMVLPAATMAEVSGLMAWVVRHWGSEAARMPVDIAAHEDTVWPRLDEREACCLLSVTSTMGTAIKEISILDSVSNTTIWSGAAEPGVCSRIRWVVEREDGFTPDDSVDLKLAGTVGSGQTERGSR